MRMIYNNTHNTNKKREDAANANPFLENMMYSSFKTCARDGMWGGLYPKRSDFVMRFAMPAPGVGGQSRCMPAAAGRRGAQLRRHDRG